MKFEFYNASYLTKYWIPEEDGCIGEQLSFDSETTLIQAKEVPDFVIGQAYSGNGVVYLIKLEKLKQFIDIHHKSQWVLHNAPFDLQVLNKETGWDFDTAIRGQKVFDTAILYRLIVLAKTGRVPKLWNLGVVAKETLDLEVSKTNSVRTDFGRYRNGNLVDYENISEAHIEYACIDAIVTYKIFVEFLNELQSLNAQYFLSHKIQLMGAIALEHMNHLGIGFDLEEKQSFLSKIDNQIDGFNSVFQDHKYATGKGAGKRLGEILEQISEELNIQLPRTRKSKALSSRSHDLEPYKEDHPFLKALLGYKETKKLRDFVISHNSSRVHPSYTLLVDTGRTASHGPNIQNLPVSGGVRECFVPAPGHCFLIVDYSTIELCTLAQVCLTRYGFSKMADLINSGEDIHRWFAAKLTNKPVDKVTKLERQQAKACNFGFPGGLGVKNFMRYARAVYELDLDHESAQALRTAWLEAFQK